MKTTPCLLLAFLTATFAQTVPDGKLTVAGQTTKLTNAYAYLTKGFFEEKQDDMVVLLTDRAITDAQLRDGFALRRLAEIITLAPWQLSDDSFTELRKHGLDDAALFDACAVASSAGMFSRVTVALASLARDRA